MDRYKISTKLLAGFGLLIAALLALSATALVQLGAIHDTELELENRWLPAMTSIDDMRIAMARRRIAAATHIATTDDSVMRDMEAEMATTEKLYAEALGRLERIDIGAGAAADLATLATLRQRYLALAQQTIGLSQRNENAAALALSLGPVSREYAAMVTRLRSIASSIEAQAEAASSLADETFDRAWWLLMVGSVLTTTLALGAAFLLRRQMVTPIMALIASLAKLIRNPEADVPFRQRQDEIGDIARAIEGFRSSVIEAERAAAAVVAEEQARVAGALDGSLDRLSAGDLTSEIAVDFPPAYASIKQNYNGALARLRDLIASVVEGTSAIDVGANEIAQASDDLARRTESSAASLEQSVNAISEIDRRVKATAEAAAVTVSRADDAIGTVTSGRGVAGQAVEAMNRVAESATGIDGVIEGLDKIAFQTRVLAMNAAVEAGRAGDAGRGFAVVADLVSALAMRAEEEAKLARDQLTVTQTEIGVAVERVLEVDGALSTIAANVGDVHQRLGGMAADNAAQATAISQVSAAVGTMDQATQQNAAMVEETSAAARSLTQEVGALARQARQFEIGKGAGSARGPLSDATVRALTRPDSAFAGF